MMTPSSVLAAFLQDIRQHPAFPELLKIIPAPAIPRFRASQAENVEMARAKWIHQSGARSQHDTWLAMLTGTAPPPEEN